MNVSKSGGGAAHAVAPYHGHIDGLRSVAVGAVLAFHCGFSFANHGYLGVDIFFVISGYLITGLIVREIDRTGFLSFSNFYLRRARRLLPNLFVMLIATALVAPLLMNAEEIRQLGKSLIATATYWSNVYFYRQEGYFSPAAEELPLLHTWSLAVEEQFYLVWPAIIVGCVWLGRRFAWFKSLHAIAAAGAISAMFFIALNRTNPDASFYLMHTRVWQFAAGAGLALFRPILNTRPPTSRLQVAPQTAIYGAAALLLWVLVEGLTGPYSRTLDPAATVLCTTVLIALCGRNDSNWISRALHSRPARYLGHASYSLYLWHWPVVVFYRFANPGQMSTLDRFVCLGLSIALGLLAYHLIEKPVRLGKKLAMLGQPRTALSFFGVVSVCLVGIGIVDLKLAPTSYSKQSGMVFSAAVKNVNPQRKACLRYPGTSALPSAGNCTLGQGSAGDPLIVVWGDSHADALFPGIAANAGMGKLVTELAKSGCPPIIGMTIRLNGAPELDCTEFNKNAFNSIRTESRARPVVVVLAARWALYIVGNNITHERSENSSEDVIPALRETLNSLAQSGVSTVVLGAVPEFNFDIPRCIVRAMHVSRTLDVCDMERLTADKRLQPASAVIRAAGAGLTRFVVVSPADVLCNRTLCPSQLGSERILYSDSDHVSLDGAQLVAKWMFARPEVQSLQLGSRSGDAAGVGTLKSRTLGIVN